MTPAIAINSAVLRQHFHRLTLQLLAPFQEYFEMRPEAKGAQAATTIVGGAVVHPYSDAKDCFARFNEASFLQNILKVGNVPVLFRQCAVHTPQQWVKLLKRFLHSPNFKPWFMARRKEGLRAFDTLKTALRLSVTPADFLAQMSTQVAPFRFEVCLRIQKALRPELARVRAEAPPPGVKNAVLNPSEHLVVAMRGHLRALRATLPADVRQSLDLGSTAPPAWLEPPAAPAPNV